MTSFSFKMILALTACGALMGCVTPGQLWSKPDNPARWTAYNSQNIPETEIQSLKEWWQRFDDPVLSQLVGLTLTQSPDRLAAQARIQEARGLRRTNRSALFPRIDGSATYGFDDNGSRDDDFYQAGFDASFEVDVFGKNRKTLEASDFQIAALEAQYHDTSLSLIAEVARTYINYRAFSKQRDIAKKNLDVQEQTLDLIETQFEFGEAPKLNVERAKNLVNTTRASLPEFQRQADNARLQLSVLTGQLPQDLIDLIDDKSTIPGFNMAPVMMVPAKVIAARPDIRAAEANLEANTKLSEATTAELFPTFTLSGFFGIAESAVSSSSTIWNVAAGAAVALLDFGRIEGRIDAARAREAEAYQLYRKAVLQAVTEVETALNDTSRINEQRISLQNAYDNAQNALEFSQTLYREGEISFIDVLDSQRTVNDAESSLITAEAAQSESLVRLYKSLGVY